MFGTIAILATAAAGASATPAREITDQWRVDRPLLAAVQNSSGEMFGLDCREGTCEYLLVMDAPCMEGVQIAALVNSQIGEAAVRLTCQKSDEFGVLSVDGVDIGPLISGDRIAFAFVRKGNLIDVARFSLSGASEAIATVRAQAKQETPDTAAQKP